MVDHSVPRSVLLVAETPDASPALAGFVRRRSLERHLRLTLLVPGADDEAELTIRRLRPAIELAAGEPISTMVGLHQPLAAVEDALNRQTFDEIVLAVQPGDLRHEITLDVARKLKALDLPVTMLGLEPGDHSQRRLAA